MIQSKQLVPTVPICIEGISAARDAYLELPESRGTGPLTLVTDPMNVGIAYKAGAEAHWNLLVVGVPGWPRESWALCGPAGIIWSLYP